jgi:hypothetical protein
VGLDVVLGVEVGAAAGLDDEESLLEDEVAGLSEDFAGSAFLESAFFESEVESLELEVESPELESVELESPELELLGA